MTLTNEVPELYWDSTYAIVVALMEVYPDRDPEETGLQELADLIESLTGFCDDLAIVTERILLDIQITWYEEVSMMSERDTTIDNETVDQRPLFIEETVKTAVDGMASPIPSSAEEKREKAWWADIF